MATLTIKDFPDDLYRELKKAARREHRTLAQQVIYLLQEAVDRELPFLRVLKGLGMELEPEIRDSSKDPQEQRPPA